MRVSNPTRYDLAGFNYFPVPTGTGVILHNATFDVLDHRSYHFLQAGAQPASLSPTRLDKVADDVKKYGVFWMASGQY